MAQFHKTWCLGEDVASPAGPGMASQTVATRNVPEQNIQRLTCIKAHVASELA